MSNRAKFRTTCAVIDIVSIVATIDVVKPQIVKGAYQSFKQKIIKTFRQNNKS